MEKYWIQTDSGDVVFVLSGSNWYPGIHLTAWLYCIVVLQPICKYYRDGQHHFFSSRFLSSPIFGLNIRSYCYFYVLFRWVCIRSWGSGANPRNASSIVGCRLCLLYTVQLFFIETNANYCNFNWFYAIEYNWLTSSCEAMCYDVYHIFIQFAICYCCICQK